MDGGPHNLVRKTGVCPVSGSSRRIRRGCRGWCLCLRNTDRSADGARTMPAPDYSAMPEFPAGYAGGGGGGVTLCFHCYYFVFLAFCRFCRRFCQYCFRYGFASFDDTRKHYQFVTASAVNPVFACTVGRKYNMGNMKCNSQSQRAGSAPSPLRLAPHQHRLTCLHDWVSPLSRCISPWRL